MMRSLFPTLRRQARLAVTVLFMLALVASCSATRAAPSHLDILAKKLRPPPGHALVYVIRPEFMGQTVRFDVKVNGAWIGSTGGFRYVLTYLKPGHYLFQSRAENLASLRVTVRVGRVYFIEQRPQMGLLAPQNELVLLPEEVGRLRLRQCALSMAMPREVLAHLELVSRRSAADPSGGSSHGQGQPVGSAVQEGVAPSPSPSGPDDQAPSGGRGDGVALPDVRDEDPRPTGPDVPPSDVESF